MEQYMDYYALTDPQRRVQLAAAFLADAAAVWWASLKSTLEDQLDAQGNVVGQVSAQARITDWEAMKQALRARFRPYMATTVARAALERLKQTRAVSEYAARFTSLVEQIDGITEQEKVWRFTSGLKLDTMRFVLMAQPKTLTEAQSVAELADESEMQARRTQPRPASFGQHAPAFNRGAPRSSAYAGGAVPMELSAIDAGAEQADGAADATLAVMPRAPLTKLTEAEREDLKRRGMCFRCRTGRHMARDCTDPVPAPRKNASGGQQ
jgi:hypothetical protein